jgi:membrane protein
MWDVTARPVSDLRGRLVRVVEKRVLAFAMVLVCAVFLLASTLMRALLVNASSMVGAQLPARWHVLDHVLSFAVSTLLFTAVFKWLPDVKIAWRDAGAGALFTSFLFAVGKLLIARYLAHKSSATVFGVAGSIVMLLLWVHYTAQIFFLGAAFTAVRAAHKGRPLAPTADALRISVES